MANPNNTNVGGDLTGTTLRNVIDNTLNNTFGFTNQEARNLMRYYDPALSQTANLEKMRDTTVWKARFKGNALLEKKGQGSISEADYLNRERAYAELMDNYSALLTSDLNKRDKTGRLIPNRDVMAKWIGGDASVAEVEARFRQAIEYVDGIDPNVKGMLAQYYGIGDDQLKKYILNFKRSDIDWNKEFATVKTGAAAAGAGIDINREFATVLGSKGFSDQQLQYGMQEVGKTADTAEMLASIGGTNLTNEELVAAEFGTNIEAKKKVKNISATEESRFTGSGAGTSILGTPTSGMI